MNQAPSVVASPQSPAAIGPYSPAVGCNGLLFCSGQIPLDPVTMEIDGTTAADQTKRCLSNLAALLKAAGIGPDRVLKTTIFLTDMADFQAVNQVYADFFSNFKPARTTIAVAALPRGAKVEIEAVAAL